MTEEELVQKLFALAFRLKNEASEMPYFNKITDGEKGILGWLHQIYPQPLLSGDIATKMNIGTGRVGNALKSLEKKGLIERKKDQDDLRKVYVSLTDEGYQYANYIHDVIQNFMKDLIKEVTPDKFESFLKLFNEVVDKECELRKRKEYQDVCLNY